MVITDLHNNIIQLEHEQDFILDDTEECLDKIGSSIDRFINDSKIDRSKLLGIGICIAGRVNPKTGRSYKYFTSREESLSEIMEKRLGHRVLIENDTRARCYGEYTKGCTGSEKNIVYLNLAVASPSESSSTATCTTGNRALPANSAIRPISITRSSATAVKKGVWRRKFPESPSKTR